MGSGQTATAIIQRGKCRLPYDYACFVIIVASGILMHQRPASEIIVRAILRF